MLSSYRSATMIPAKDLAGTRHWYEEVLGLTPSSEDPGSVVYRSGDTQLNLYATQAAGTAEHTLIGWMVDDIDRVVDQLAAKGVRFERYDLPDFKTDDRGIASMGEHERAAWFKDPEGNLLSLWQLTA